MVASTLKQWLSDVQEGETQASDMYRFCHFLTLQTLNSKLFYHYYLSKISNVWLSILDALLLSVVVFIHLIIYSRIYKHYYDNYLTVSAHCLSWDSIMCSFMILYMGEGITLRNPTLNREVVDHSGYRFTHGQCRVPQAPDAKCYCSCCYKITNVHLHCSSSFILEPWTGPSSSDPEY